jgi:hypothetical protein
MMKVWFLFWFWVAVAGWGKKNTHTQASLDQSVLDSEVNYAFGWTIMSFLQLVGTVVLMSQVSLVVPFVFLPGAIACFWMQVKKKTHLSQHEFSFQVFCIEFLETLCIHTKGTFIYLFCITTSISKFSFIKKSDFISWILLFLNSKFHLINYLIYN